MKKVSYNFWLIWWVTILVLVFLFSFSSSCSTVASEASDGLYNEQDTLILSSTKRCKLLDNKVTSTTSTLPYKETHTINSKLPVPLSLPKSVEIIQDPEECYPTDQVRIEIYMYHYVRPTRWDQAWSIVYNNSVTPEIARDHYAHLATLEDSNTINVAFMSEIEKYERQNCFPNRRMVVLTFDDGRRDNYEFLLPLAKEFNIKANLWIIVNRITSWHQERVDSFMNFQEILEMQQSWWFEIQSHSRTHTNLQQKDRDQQWIEICESTKYLEQIFDIDINTFIYPMWLYNFHSTEIVSQCWLTYGLSTREWIDTKYQLDTVPFQLNRIRVNKGIRGKELFGE